MNIEFDAPSGHWVARAEGGGYIGGASTPLDAVCQLVVMLEREALSELRSARAELKELEQAARRQSEKLTVPELELISKGRVAWPAVCWLDEDGGQEQETSCPVGPVQITRVSLDVIGSPGQAVVWVRYRRLEEFTQDPYHSSEYPELQT